MITRYTTEIRVVLCLALLAGAAACRGGTERPAASEMRVTDVTIGRAIGTDKAVSDRTDSFKPADTIYASVATEGSSPSGVLRAKWTYGEGQLVDESTRTIAAGSRERTEFHIAKPDGWPVGKYKLELFLNDKLAETKTFDVSH